MQVFPNESERIGALENTSVARLAGNDRLAPARGLVYGALLGLMAWTLLITALWG